jgi:probable rRNA maturation factor
MQPPPTHRISIRGLGRTLGVNRRDLRGLLLDALSAERAPAGELALAFVSERVMRRINRDYRGRDETTDVLSFSYVDELHTGGLIGEVYVAPAVAERQAAAAGCSLAEELARLAVHGLLHILGYDHDSAAKRRRMFTRQERYLDRLSDAGCRP